MTYRNVILTNAICLSLALISAELAQAQQYAIRNIDVPGAAATTKTPVRSPAAIAPLISTVAPVSCWPMEHSSW